MINTAKLAELIESSGRYKENSVSYVLDCPRCDKRDKVFVYKDTGRFICFVCAESDNYRGRPEFLLADLLKRPLADIRSELYGSSLPEAREPGRKWGEAEEDDTPDIIHPVNWGPDYRPIDQPIAVGEKYRQYLADRGIDLATAVKHGIRFHPPGQSVVFPVESAHTGKLYGWQERLIFNPETGPKAKTSKGLHKGRFLMFERNLIGSPHAIVCEGPIDAIKASLCGGAVCTLGKVVSPRQRELMTSHGASSVYLALDNDAMTEMQALYRDFAADGLAVYWMKIPAGRKDFGECTPEETLQAFKNAKRVTPMTMWRRLG